MKNGFRKAAVISLSACLALGSLSGCSKKEAFDAAAAAVSVNGDEISAGLVKFSAHYSQAMLEDLYTTYMGLSDPMSQDLYGNGSTLGDMVKEDMVSSLENMVLAEQKMGDYGVELTEEEKASVAQAAAQFIDDNGEEVLEKMGAAQDVVERYLTLRLIQAKMEPKMSADADTEVSDDEAAQRKVQYTLFRAETEAETEEETGTEAESAGETEAAEEATEDGTEATEAVTEGETSLETEAETAALTEQDTVKTGAAEETETAADTEAAEETETAADTEAAEETEAAAETEDGTEAAESETETETEDPAMAAAKEAAKAKAEELIAKVQAGEDFETASDEVDPDATCTTTTFGADSTTVVDALITATEGLEDGTLVEEPIEAESGYYVAQVVSKLDREATDEKKNEIVEDRKSERINELYTEWKDAAEVTENQDVLAQIVFDFSLSQETEAQTAAEETETEAVTEAAETGTEAVTEAAETETEAVTEAAETDTEAVTEAAETETEAAAEAAAEAETEAVTEAAAETETEAVTEAVTEAETEAVTE